MRFTLISGDTKLQTLCREALHELLGQNGYLTCASAADAAHVADVYLWDVDSDLSFVDSLTSEEQRRHLFFIDRPLLQEFRDKVPQTTNVLLKPLTKPALLAFLSSACQKVGPTQSDSVEGLRADRDQMLQCLFQTNLKLQEYDQERTNFLARAIHDFRAPLTAITGYCGLLLGEDLGSLTEEQRQVLERMNRSATKLSRMANAMFQLSIAPRAESVPDFHPADISDCIEQAVHEITPNAQDKRLAINVNMRPLPRPLCFDRTKIEQVLVNLLENACKFAPRGGAIHVAGYPWHWDNPAHGPATGNGSHNEPNSYRLDVSDSGPGIPATHLSRIFEEYTSYGGGSDRSGGGLGLAICRMILRQHQGRIWAESTASGATFSFVLPYANSRSAPLAETAHRNTSCTFSLQQN